MEKLFIYLRDLLVKFLQEKFAAFRSGFLAGGAISLPFLLHVQGFSYDMIWVFPLKLFMSVCFAFCTGLASHGAKSAWSYIMKRSHTKKKKINNKPKP